MMVATVYMAVFCWSLSVLLLSESRSVLHDYGRPCIICQEDEQRGVRFFFAWLGLPQPCSPPRAQCKKMKRTQRKGNLNDRRKHQPNELAFHTRGDLLDGRLRPIRSGSISCGCAHHPGAGYSAQPPVPL